MQLDFSTRRAQVSWDDEKRIFLCCLYKFFEKDSSAFEEIFSAKYKRDLENSGFTDGRTSNRTLHTQWWDMKRHGDPIWGKVHKSPLNSGDWLPIKEMIIDVAQYLGISLVERDKDDIDTSKYRPRTPRPVRTSAPESAPTSAPALSFSSENSTPLSGTIIDHQNNSPSGRQNLSINKQSLSVQPLTQHGGKICWWCLDQGDDAAELNTPSTLTWTPPLLYRWSNADSQGINTPKRYTAGLFADSEVSPFLPEDIPPEKFNDYVLKHVERITPTSHPTPSPFISTFKSILAPIHRAVRGMEGARVSIIDTMKLNGPLYSARDLVRKNKIKIRGYSGIGEYLIWGDVPTPAIICSFKISTLIQIAQDNEDIGRILQLDRIASKTHVRGNLRTVLSKETGSMNLNHASGVSLGKLLHFINVPEAYYQMVGEGIIRSWQLQKQGAWQEFQQGLEVGFTRLYQSSFSPYQVGLDATPPGRTLAKPTDKDCLFQDDSTVDEEEEEGFEEIGEEDEEEDEVEHDDDTDDVHSIFDTPCPVRTALSVSSIITPDARPLNRIELYDPVTRNWSLAEESQQYTHTEAESFSQESSVIVLDDFEEEIEELGDLIMGEDIADLSTPDHPPKDQFATDRERIKRLLK
ncbi:hypothetical protein CDV55_104936 [Aspergillus turcosus]|uniref:DUF7587 domain-containing protein n=1 Tax=Aspergillus turcosus TaxID=1245748 RepID=A0A229XPZ4_9EURO|nr:hypothetical protein CDV55_104936 [Aspergillus turcosus]RLM01861.1 hypothetical protein CFD26_109138 [Aspergillus turcosus]